MMKEPLPLGVKELTTNATNFTFKETVPFQIQVSPALKHANALLTNHRAKKQKEKI